MYNEDEVKIGGKVYFPFFYRHLALVGSLSNEEFGELMRAILSSEGSIPPKGALNPKLEIAYNFIVDDTARYFSKNGCKPQAAAPQRYPTHKKQEEPKKEEAPKQRYGSFDPIDAFKKAVARTYGSSDGAEKFI